MKSVVNQVAEDVQHKSNEKDEVMYTPPTTFQGWLNLTMCCRTRVDMFLKRTKDNKFLLCGEYWLEILTIYIHNRRDEFNDQRLHPYGNTPEDLRWYLARRAENGSGVPMMKRYCASIRWEALCLRDFHTTIHTMSRDV
jgi:hypothetical protein